MHRSKFSCPQYFLEVNGQLHTSATLLQEKEPTVLLCRWLGRLPRADFDDMEK
jgi:hypothetical protein